ncbi:yeats family-domain-containing protein [Biscogniauxia marginata]|nr:yeats family-domain-containing protein [Biscogniauxia marginata]
MPERFDPAEPTDTKNNTSGASSSTVAKTAKSSKMQIERKVKLVTEQHTIPKESPMPEFPMKEWSVKIYLLDEDGNEHPANCFTKAVYNLHPSFENPQQTFTEPPFTCTNEGWGEFEMSIDLYTTEKAKHTIYHDLNFQSPKYEAKQTVTIKNPSQNLINLLRETGPVGNDDDAKASKARKANDGKKRKAPYDYEKMADGMGKLGEDDLLHIIQMIHDNKSEDTFIKNDLDKGEFTVDLCTLSDALLKMVWDFLVDLKMIS